MKRGETRAPGSRLGVSLGHRRELALKFCESRLSTIARPAHAINAIVTWSMESPAPGACMVHAPAAISVQKYSATPHQAMRLNPRRLKARSSALRVGDESPGSHRPRVGE